MRWRIAATVVAATALAAVLAIDWSPLALPRQSESESLSAAQKTNRLPLAPTSAPEKSVGLDPTEVGSEPARN